MYYFKGVEVPVELTLNEDNGGKFLYYLSIGIEFLNFVWNERTKGHVITFTSGTLLWATFSVMDSELIFL
jgi:hypothetical protein